MFVVLDNLFSMHMCGCKYKVYKHCTLFVVVDHEGKNDWIWVNVLIVFCVGGSKGLTMLYMP